MKIREDVQDVKRVERRRIISKTGVCNTQLYSVSDKNRRLMQVRMSSSSLSPSSDLSSGCFHHHG